MGKKFFSMCLVIAVSVTLCACGSDLDEQEAAKEYASAEAAGKQGMISAAPESTVAPAAAKAAQESAMAAPKVTETPKTAEATAVPKATESPASAAETTGTPKPTATPTAKETAAPTATETTAKETAVPKETEPTGTTTRETAEPKDATAPTATPEPVHTHTFVDKTVSEASCTEAKVIESVCSVCGASDGTRTEGSALGHVYGYDSWWFEPTCSSGGYKNEICGICGADMGGESVDPLPHDWEETSTTGYDCMTSGVTRQTCKSCGAPGDSWENGQYGDHDWVTFIAKEMNWETLEETEIEVTQCRHCGAEQ